MDKYYREGIFFFNLNDRFDNKTDFFCLFLMYAQIEPESSIALREA